MVILTFFKIYLIIPQIKNTFILKSYPIFFNTLNKVRDNDLYALPDGTQRCIPFLNGGLFEEDHEPTEHRQITFPVHQFEDLFNFLNSYNFTIYENSPEEHTVAVDPEMLGHIFENLLEDNKDKGAFYTLKRLFII